MSEKKKTKEDYETEEALEKAISAYLVDHGAPEDQVNDIMRMMVWQAKVAMRGQNMIIGFILMIMGVVILSAILTMKEVFGGNG